MPLDYKREVQSEEYFVKKRAQHWTTFPLLPISTGQARKKFPEISKAYDQAMIVHPAMAGFTIRWRGPNETEQMFIHPMFQGFTLPKKGLTPSQKAKIQMETQMSRDKVRSIFTHSCHLIC